jgi:hypothetical protein
MELSILVSDTALLLFTGIGLIATGLAIMRDIPIQRRMSEQPIPIDRRRAA